MKTRGRALADAVATENRGKIARIYTTKVAAQLQEDLVTLKRELRIE